MRAVDLYENTEIDDWLDRVVLGTWKRSSDGSIDVNGIVHIPEETNIIPVQFGYVNDNFDCSDTKIASLEGSPKRVGGSFNCDSTNITSLKGSPKKIDGYFNCNRTNITSLEGGPEKVGKNFYCAFISLTPLKGAPKEVGNKFYCYNTKITDPYEYRYALLSVISSEFVSDIKEVNEIINTYGWDGSNNPKSKRKVPIGLQKLKELSDASN